MALECRACARERVYECCGASVLRVCRDGEGGSGCAACECDGEAGTPRCQSMEMARHVPEDGGAGRGAWPAGAGQVTAGMAPPLLQSAGSVDLCWSRGFQSGPAMSGVLDGRIGKKNGTPRQRSARMWSRWKNDAQEMDWRKFPEDNRITAHYHCQLSVGKLEV